MARVPAFAPRVLVAIAALCAALTCSKASASPHALDLVTDAEAKSIDEQYGDALYSDFVEADDNQVLYNHYFHHSFFQKLESVLTALTDVVGRNVSVLDLACGNGILARKAKAQMPSLSIVGADATDSMIAQARRLALESSNTALRDIKFVGPINASDLSTLSEHGQFDVIVSGFFLSHAQSKKDLRAYLTEMSAHLRPGGVTLHVIPNAVLPEGSAAELPDGTVERVRLPVKASDKVCAPSDHAKFCSTSQSQNTNNSNEPRWLELFDFHWTNRTYRELAEDAGLVDVTYEHGEISPEGLAKLGLSYDELPVKVSILYGRKPRM